MWLIICNDGDEPAEWVYEGLSSRGLDPLKLVYSGDLEFGVTWVHRLGKEGVFTEIHMPDGYILRTSDLKGTLNRMELTYNNLALFQPDDKQYVMSEIRAFYMSWLNSLPGPLLNKPSTQGLAGIILQPPEWLALAGSVGLETVDYTHSARGSNVLDSKFFDVPADEMTTVIVAAGKIFGEKLSVQIQKHCLDLAKETGLGILGINFLIGEEGTLRFHSASPVPDLRNGSEEFLDHLFRLFIGEWRWCQ